MGAGGLALLLFLCLKVVATSPHASLYAMQAVTCLLLFLLAFRFLKARASADPAESLGPRWELWAALVLCVGVFVWIHPLYFLAEDFWILRLSPQPALQTLGEVLRHGWGKGKFLRPVAAATFILDYRLWQAWPPGYHLTNLLLFMSAVLGVYVAGRSLGLERRESGTAALLFSCLPVHVGTIARIAARDELLATPLALWALVLYARFRREGHWANYGGALALFLLAAFSKENAFVFPALLVALELLVLPTRRFRPVVGFVLVGLLAFAYRWMILNGIGGYRDYRAFSNIGLHTIGTLGVALPTQSLFGLNWVQPPQMEAVLLASVAAGLFAGLALGAKLDASGRRWAAFWGLWMVISALPVHSLLFLGPDLVGSHRLYLGSVGLCFLLAHLLERLQPARLQAAWKLVLVVVLAAGFLHNLQAYRWACALSQKFNAELLRLEPSPPPGTIFVFHDLPNKIRGVSFWGGPPRLRFLYGRDDVNTLRLGGPSSGSAAGRPQVHFRWTGNLERPLERLEVPIAASPRETLR